MKLLKALQVYIRADASGAIAALEKLYEQMLDFMMPIEYHDHLCGMRDGTEWDVFV